MLLAASVIVGSELPLAASPHPAKRSRFDQHERPIAAVGHYRSMLRSQPALPTFAASAKSGGGRTHAMRTKPPLTKLRPMSTLGQKHLCVLDFEGRKHSINDAANFQAIFSQSGH
ncbi:MAG: hypothetical protein ACI9PY_002939 [Ascidiaceihabitans sp.]|jgi:hypothetical protein